MAATPPQPSQLSFSLRFERRAKVANVGGVATGAWGVILGAEMRRALVAPTALSSRSANEEVIAGRMSGRVQYDIWMFSDRVVRTLVSTDRAVNIRTGEIYNLGQPIDLEGKRRWLLVQAVSGGNAEGTGIK